MPGRRYTVVIADRSSGVVRQLTVNRRWLALAVATILAIPVLMGLGAKWSANAQIEELARVGYPARIVDHGTERIDALARWDSIRRVGKGRSGRNTRDRRPQ